MRIWVWRRNVDSDTLSSYLFPLESVFTEYPKAIRNIFYLNHIYNDVSVSFHRIDTWLNLMVSWQYTSCFTHLNGTPKSIDSCPAVPAELCAQCLKIETEIMHFRYIGGRSWGHYIRRSGKLMQTVALICIIVKTPKSVR